MEAVVRDSSVEMVRLWPRPEPVVMQGECGAATDEGDLRDGARARSNGR